MTRKEELADGRLPPEILIVGLRDEEGRFKLSEDSNWFDARDPQAPKPPESVIHFEVANGVHCTVAFTTQSTTIPGKVYSQYFCAYEADGLYEQISLARKMAGK